MTVALLAISAALPSAGQEAVVAPATPPDLQSLGRTLRENPRPEIVEPLVPSLLAAAGREETAADALPIIEHAIELLQPAAAEQQKRHVIARLLRTAARLRFHLADPVKANQHLQRLLAIHRADNEQDRDLGRSGLWSGQLNDVALEYLRGGQLGAALEALGEAADLGLPSHHFDDGRASVSAALNRRLEALSTDERFELLHPWIMPTESRRSVRTWSSLAPLEAPPSVFARALGERPRTTSFALPEVNGVRGLFSVEWQWVQAAEQSGRLRRLTSELEELVKEDVPNADYLLLLARVAAASVPRDEQLWADLNRLLDRVQLRPDRLPHGAAGARPDVFTHEHWAVIGSACMERLWLQPFARDVFERMSNVTRVGITRHLHPFFRRASAVAILKRHPGTRRELIDDPHLPLWIPTVVENSESSVAGATRGLWVGHEDHVLQLAGAASDYLCFRYPLTGSFEFQVEAQAGGEERALGHVTYGGMVYEPSGANGSFKVWSVGGGPMTERPFPFVRRGAWMTYHRLALKVSGDETTLLVNGHPAWSDSMPHQTSPWLGIGSTGNRATVFRNFQLTGDPVIPREVRLAEGNELRGWYSHFDSEVAAPSPLEDPGLVVFGGGFQALPASPLSDRGDPPTDKIGWSLSDGVIHGARTSGLASASRLSYFRPLQDGESITYEFLYEPDRHVVHPALGRLAFLFEPDGVQLRWLTNGESDWTGLSVDNSVTEPLARRGPRPLPLNAGDWNRVTLALADDNAVTLTLNETTVYSRKLEPDNSRTFGFYHDRSRGAARIRNVTMRGDWPERLNGEQLASPVARGESVRTPVERQAIGDLFAERHLADSALAVHRRAMAMPINDRYEFLAQWVLPSPDHATLRLALDFTPTHPAPPAADVDPWDQQRLEIAAQTGRSRVQIGGNLVAPALDLIEAARQVGRLDEVRRRVEQAPEGDAYQQRCRLAMLALVDIAREDYPPAVDALFELFGAIESADHTEFAQRWPETLATHTSLLHPETRVAGREIAYHLFLRQARNGADSGSEAWRRQVAALAGLARRFDLETGDTRIENFTAQPALTQWKTASRSTARSRGLGFPKVHWQLTSDGPQNFASHDDDYLYFQSPLRGNYEVQCEVPAFGWRDTQLSVAGLWVGLSYTRDAYIFGHLRTNYGRPAIQPPITKVGGWLSYRIVVRDGQSTTYVNGRQIHEQPLDEHHVPWLAVRAPRENGAARNLRIVGQPEIPSEIWLAVPNLVGWLVYHDTDGVGGPQSSWLHSADTESGDGIVGRHRPESAGSQHESLLQYHRPMLEDGTIEYDFYYREGSSLCHPAVDRLAFLLDPSGVQIHWITDGVFDRSQLPPDNRSVEPGNRRGPERLPLKNDDWNRLRLSLVGDTVHLVLNGEPIYERVLEPSNQRTFGLFHYADQTEARVRHVVWRGEWPREFPPLAVQELAEDETGFLDQRLPELTAVFEHDFANDGLPTNQFSIVRGEVPHHFQTTPDGLHAERQGAEGYRNATIAPRLNVEGDFDITVCYDQLNTQASTPGTASLMLMAQFEDPASHECIVYRRQTIGDTGVEEQIFQTTLVFREGGETRRHYSPAEPFEATAGKLRLARRGNVVHFLIAEGDSPLFRLVRTKEVTDRNVAIDGIRLMVQTQDPGYIGVVWKSLSIRAEALSGQALEDNRETVAELDRQRQALPARFIHDFTRDTFSSSRFHHWAFTPSVPPDSMGQRVRGQASDEWKSAGVAAQVALQGDFDVSFDFDILRMDRPKPGKYSAVYLQMEFPGSEKLQCNVIVKASEADTMHASAHLRLRNDDGSFSYPSLRQDQVDKVGRMRLARRGKQLHFLYAEDRSQPDRLLARYEVPDDATQNASLRLIVHTGGEDRVTETAWKKLSIHAGGITHAR